MRPAWVRRSNDKRGELSLSHVRALCGPGRPGRMAITQEVPSRCLAVYCAVVTGFADGALKGQATNERAQPVQLARGGVRQLRPGPGHITTHVHIQTDEKQNKRQSGVTKRRLAAWVTGQRRWRCSCTMQGTAQPAIHVPLGSRCLAAAMGVMQ